ncbi:MAG: response regulator transcription factor [Actinomycetota bacterium]
MSIPTKLVSLVIADHRQIFREGLEASIGRSTNLTVTASVSTTDEAVTVCRAHPPSVLLVGDVLSEHDLAEAANFIGGLHPEIRPILICSYMDHISELIEIGFWGCVPQTISGPELSTAITAVAQGEFWAPRSVLTRLIRERIVGGGCGDASVSTDCTRLTRRESEILELVSRGYSNDQIATALFIGRSTVKTHLIRTFRKLEAVDRASAVSIALGRNLIKKNGD